MYHNYTVNAVTTPIYWRTEYSFRKRGCAANKKTRETKCFRYSRCKLGLHRLITQGALLRQNIGAASILFVSGRSDFIGRFDSALVVAVTENLEI